MPNFSAPPSLQSGTYTFEVVSTTVENITTSGGSTIEKAIYKLRDIDKGLSFDYHQAYFPPREDSKGTGWIFVSLFKTCGLQPTGKSASGNEEYNYDFDAINGARFVCDLFKGDRGYLEVDVKSFKSFGGVAPIAPVAPVAGVAGKPQDDDDLPF